ncbi:MAG: hypothetical protein ACXWIP_09705 [Burkholderiales bacterium]
MLVLRPAQLDVIEQHMIQYLQRRVERAIAASFPELNDVDRSAPQGVPSERVKGIVDRGIDSAVGLGIEEAPDLAAFIALGLALRTVPPETPTEWIKSWLARPDTAGATKLAIIEALLAQSDADNPALLAVAERVAQARRHAVL